MEKDYSGHGELKTDGNKHIQSLKGNSGFFSPINTHIQTGKYPHNTNGTLPYNVHEKTSNDCNDTVTSCDNHKNENEIIQPESTDSSDNLSTSTRTLNILQTATSDLTNSSSYDDFSDSASTKLDALPHKKYDDNGSVSTVPLEGGGKYSLLSLKSCLDEIECCLNNLTDNGQQHLANGHAVSSNNKNESLRLGSYQKYIISNNTDSPKQSFCDIGRDVRHSNLKTCGDVIGSNVTGKGYNPFLSQVEKLSRMNASSVDKEIKLFFQHGMKVPKVLTVAHSKDNNDAFPTIYQNKSEESEISSSIESSNMNMKRSMKDNRTPSNLFHSLSQSISNDSEKSSSNESSSCDTFKPTSRLFDMMSTVKDYIREPPTKTTFAPYRSSSFSSPEERGEITTAFRHHNDVINGNPIKKYTCDDKVAPNHRIDYLMCNAARKGDNRFAKFNPVNNSICDGNTFRTIGKNLSIEVHEGPPQEMLRRGVVTMSIPGNNQNINNEIAVARPQEHLTEKGDNYGQDWEENHQEPRHNNQMQELNRQMNQTLSESFDDESSLLMYSISTFDENDYTLDDGVSLAVERERVSEEHERQQELRLQQQSDGRGIFRLYR